MTTDTAPSASEPTEAAAPALNPAQRKAQTKFGEEIKKESATIEQRFGTKLEIQADFSTFKEAEWANQSVSSRGNEVLSAIVRLSDDVDYKPDLVKQLRLVRFTFDGKPGAMIENISFSAGVLSYATNRTHNNLLNVTYDVLTRALSG